MQTTRRRSRRGYVLVLALGFATLVTITGMAYLESAATTVPQADNLRRAARAENLAVSGFSLAAHYLAVPPSTVAVGTFWPGVAGLSIDGTADTCTVTLSRSGTQPEVYSVTSAATVLDEKGNVAAQRTAQTEIVTPPPKVWEFQQAFIGQRLSVTVPWDVNVVGSVHVNGNLIHNGTCTGAVSATGTVTWNDEAPPASITPGAASIALPLLNTANWSRYVIHGVVNRATAYAGGAFTPTTVTTLGGSSSRRVYWQSGRKAVVYDTTGTLFGGVTGLGVNVNTTSVLLAAPATIGTSMLSMTNVGGVIVSASTLQADSISYLGTLVVNGDFRVNSSRMVVINSMPYFPALVVTGDIDLGSDSVLTVRGPIICGGRMKGNTATLNHFGTYISFGDAFASDFCDDGAATLTWDVERNAMYDFAPGSADPMTLLSWKQ